MRQIRKIVRDKRGEGYIDVAVMVLCVMLVIALGVRLFPIFITKMQVDNFADELAREAEISGRVGSETSNRQRVLEERTGIHPTVQWSRTGNLQLNEEVTVTVTIQKDLGLFGNFGSFPITIRARASGKSEVHVRHNALLTNAQTTVSDTLKTSAAVRDIPIPPTLFAELVKERKGAKSLYVLHMRNGKPLSKSSFKSMRQTIESRTVDDPADLWTTAPHSKVVRTLDFHVHPHQLRHTYITRLFESGLDIKEIQYLAGHATVNMTLRVYTHYQHESRQQSTAQKVCAAFG